MSRTEQILLTNPKSTLQEVDVHFMGLCLKQAEAAEEQDEVPVGALVVLDGKVIGRGSNQNKMLSDPTAHAEMIAISAACNHVAGRYLENATLYVTIEPCSMCAGAIVLARVQRLVYGAKDPKTGACGSLFNIVRDPRLNHQVEVVVGMRETECAALISEFFERIRDKKK